MELSKNSLDIEEGVCNFILLNLPPRLPFCPPRNSQLSFSQLPTLILAFSYLILLFSSLILLFLPSHSHSLTSHSLILSSSYLILSPLIISSLTSSSRLSSLVLTFSHLILSSYKKEKILLICKESM